MARKRVRSELVNERRRNNVFNKRIESLKKQANDLSILCGVEIGIVVHCPAEQDNAILWPTPQLFRDRMEKFLDFPEMERSRKMVIHGDHIEERLKDESEERVKLCEKNKFIELRLLMNELITGRGSFQEVDLVRLNDLQIFVTEILEKLRIREDELKNGQD